MPDLDRFTNWLFALYAQALTGGLIKSVVQA